MADTPQSLVVKRALLAVSALQEKLKALESARSEPIAVVGIGCRFPGGAESPDAFWRLLVEGRDAVADLPRDRWDIDAYYDAERGAPGKIVTRRAACVGQVDRFDPQFFGISPRETKAMDPQQRLSLEVAWEAVEDAGIVAERLAGSRTGVFMGVMHHDYAFLLYEQLDALDAYASTGTHYSIIANRISFTLDLRGPSVAVDTACSSSLTAVHAAVQSLRRRECDLALAGGVNLILSPMQSIAYSKWGMLSPEGRCYTFDARANGFVRGEGCGVVVLERLSDALASGDPIHAIIRGSAVSQDGKTSVMTAPSGLAQQQVIRDALADGGVDPASVTYVETHGTGTPLGDPIEVEALASVYGKPAGPPCVLGAVKTNVGHLEGAAGIAGFIKAVLCLERGLIPPNLNFTTMNPRVPIEESRLALATELRAWDLSEQRRFAGVSSFGAGGTNAHVVLEQAPSASPAPPSPERSAELLVLSAKSAAALSAQARNLSQHLASNPSLALGDIAFSLATTRSAMDHRLAVVAGSRDALREVLDAAAEQQSPAGVIRGQASLGASPKVVFVFPGQGSQWVGMGQKLLSEEPAFRAALEACDGAIQKEAGFSLLAELAADAACSQLGRIDVVQPVLFAMAVGLSELWRSWGVTPDAVVGHSMGEVAAAHVAGALSLEDAVAIICRRSRLLRRISGRGEMAMVELPLADAEAALVGYEARVSVAVSNSPRSTVLSGEPAALAEVLAALDAQGVFCRRVKVDVASHSPQVEPLREELVSALSSLRPGRASVAMRSTVTGALVNGPELAAEYWADNLRKPVRFGEAVQSLAEGGHLLFMEMSPHPILVPPVEECLRAAKRQGAAVGSLRRGQDERAALFASLGALWVHGVPVSWTRLFPAGGRRVPLPTYPWQRERYWLDLAPRPAARANERFEASRSDTMPCQEDTSPSAIEAIDLAAGDPAAILEAHLARQLAGVLRLNPASIERHATFASLGLDSLTGLELRNRLESSLGQKLPTALLLKHPSVAALAAQLLPSLRSERREQPAPPSWSPLIELQPAGLEPPLFFVHPLGGTVSCYVDLARQLGANRPFYALQARGIDAGAPPIDRIDEMASVYLDALRTAQQHGPYFLGGWSFGGVVAFEMAQQLIRAGERVARLVMVDTPFPRRFTAKEVLLAQAMQLFPDLDRALQRQGVALDRIDAAVATSVESVLAAHAAAVVSYAPRTYPGVITFLRVEEVIPRAVGTDSADLYVDTDREWHDCTSRPMIVHRLPGNHVSIILEPHVRQLAASLKRCLDEG